MSITGSILVVDDERSMRDFMRIALGRAGHVVEVVDSPAAAHQMMNVKEFDLVITDLKMPGGSGLDVLETVKATRPNTQVVVVTAFATTETAIAAMKNGAYDYLTKPFKIDEIGVVVERALEKRKLLRDNVELRAELEGRFRLDRLVGKSPPTQQLFELIRKVAPAKTTVLVSGESGTGKELVARALHHLSPREKKPFVAVNCGAIPETLIESELFGHIRGSFTGADRDKVGLFASAEGGTLFLDEIGELPSQVQAKLLRALQERAVKPVGATSEQPFDVRLIAATNRDLEADVERGAFRRDLYYRLNVIQLQLAPLRARREDIPLLVEHFLAKHGAALDRKLQSIDPEAMAVLVDYDYPGNIRELENIIERAVTLESGERITKAVLPQLHSRTQVPAQTSLTELPPDGIDIDQVVGELERKLVLLALERTSNSRKLAAQLLHISMRSLRYRLAKHGLGPQDESAPNADDDTDAES